jgi:ABC-2 type transport system ATP-binding protein
VGGHRPQLREPDFLKSITLVMGQKQQLIWDLPPAETFALNRAIYDIPRPVFEETVGELSTLLELGDLVNRPARQLSLGERMKCELAAALLHRPRVLFLDEPTIGLDVSMQDTVRRFVKAYNERFEATVILTSHYMEDVVQLCPRVVVIDQGRLIHDGDLRELTLRLRPDKRIALRFSGAAPAAAELARFGAVVEAGGVQATVQVKADQVAGVVGALLAALPVADLTVEDPPLEEVMKELFSRGRSDAAG